MRSPENILNHMARVCHECGSANFALLKSGGIECNKCGARLSGEWGNFKQQIQPFKPTEAKKMSEAQTLTADEASTFHEIACAFDLDGESQHDIATLLDYASRGLLRCTGFEVTEEGRKALSDFYK